MDQHVVIYVCDRCGFTTEEPNDMVTWTVGEDTQDVCRSCVTKAIDEEVLRLRQAKLNEGN